MNDKKLTEIATEKKPYKQTDDIRQAIQFKYAKYCSYSADNCLYDDQPEDEHYIKMIDYRLRDVAITVDTESLILLQAEIKKPIVVLPLSSISSINYLYYKNTCDICFIFADSFLVDMSFDYLS